MEVDCQEEFSSHFSSWFFAWCLSWCYLCQSWTCQSRAIPYICHSRNEWLFWSHIKSSLNRYDPRNWDGRRYSQPYATWSCHSCFLYYHGFAQRYASLWSHAGKKCFQKKYLAKEKLHLSKYQFLIKLLGNKFMNSTYHTTSSSQLKSIMARAKQLTAQPECIWVIWFTWLFQKWNWKSQRFVVVVWSFT